MNTKSKKFDKFLDLASQWLEMQLKPVNTLETTVEAKVKNLALEHGLAEIFDKIGKGNNQEVDDRINKEKQKITEYATKIILEKFGK